MSFLPTTMETSRLKVEEPSGRSTPIFSWSPLPQRKKLAFVNGEVSRLTSTFFLIVTVFSEGCECRIGCGFIPELRHRHLVAFLRVRDRKADPRENHRRHPEMAQRKPAPERAGVVESRRHGIQTLIRQFRFNPPVRNRKRNRHLPMPLPPIGRLQTKPGGETNRRVRIRNVLRSRSVPDDLPPHRLRFQQQQTYLRQCYDFFVPVRGRDFRFYRMPDHSSGQQDQFGDGGEGRCR